MRKVQATDKDCQCGVIQREAARIGDTAPQQSGTIWASVAKRPAFVERECLQNAAPYSAVITIFGSAPNAVAMRYSTYKTEFDREPTIV